MAVQRFVSILLVLGLLVPCLQGCVSMRPVREARGAMAPGPHGPSSRFLTLGGASVGRTVHVEVEGAGPPVVLIHGFGGSSYTFRKVLGRLANSPPAGYRVIALDLYGFGLSDRPDDREVYTPAGQAGMVLDVLDALGERSAHVIGHSFGGGVALALAERFPERVRSLVLVDTTLPTHSRAPRADLPLYRPFAYLFLRTVGLRRLFVRGALRKAFHDDSLVTPELVDAYRDRLRLRGAASVYRGLTLPIPRRRLDVNLAGIERATLVVWGERDALIPVEAGRRAAANMGARFVAIPECGHLPMEERPAELLDVVTGFLEDVERLDGSGQTLGRDTWGLPSTAKRSGQSAASPA